MTQKSVRVVAVQLNSREDVRSNLARCLALAEEAGGIGAQVVLLPENFAYCGPEAGKRQLAEPLGSGPIQDAVAEMARRSGAVIIAGGWPEQSPDPDRPFNTCTVVGTDGDVVARYRKIHLFDVELPDGARILESAATTRGETPVVTPIRGFRFGLSICYDVRFPELYRALTREGAEVLAVPAAFTLQTGKDHWHVLLRARAIESQCWVIAAAQWGRAAEGRVCYGHSMIVDPWGVVVAESSDRDGIITADLDRVYLDDVREKLPSLAHRRL